MVAERKPEKLPDGQELEAEEAFTEGPSLESLQRTAAEFSGFVEDLSREDHRPSFGPSLQFYIDQTRRRPLLTAEQEITLAQAIKAGIEAEKRLTNNPLSVEEKEHLESLVEEAKVAREIFVESNLRLVINVARRYLHLGLDFDDLIQEGNIGLMRAVGKFDCSKGFRFSTYATWWIRQGITRAIADDGRTIRVPAYVIEILNRLRRVLDDMNMTVNDTFTREKVKEVATILELPDEKIVDLIEICRLPISLETPVGSEENEATIADFVADGESPSTFEAVAQHLLSRTVSELLTNLLSPRQARVIGERFGLDGYIEARSLATIGEELGVSRERIRQIEDVSLRTLRDPRVLTLLRDYLE